MTRFAVVLACALMAGPALAQPTNFGVGGQVGDPTGITMRFGGLGTALDLAAGWNISDNRLFAQLHVIMAQPRLGAPPANIRFFYGPGGFVGVRDDDVTLGVSFNGGLSFYMGRVELFGQLTPRLQLVDETSFDLGGAVGLRYYF